jgi:hypothetical protein
LIDLGAKGKLNVIWHAITPLFLAWWWMTKSSIKKVVFHMLLNWISVNSWVYLIDWLIDYLRFYVPLKNFSLICRRHHCPRRAAKFRPMLGAQGLWAGKDLYRATPAVTRDLGFSGLIRRTAPFSRLLRHTRGCRGSILTRILTGLTTLGQGCRLKAAVISCYYYL